MKQDAYRKLGKINFPKSNDININMMPFIIGDKNSIPNEYRNYYSLIEHCVVPQNEMGKIGYLSISESLVKQDNSQRRGGIHTEKHGNINWGGSAPPSWGGSTGLFIASTVDNSCRAWNIHIDDPGVMGDCEHLRYKLGNGELMKANELIWMTDSCPHESMPVKNDVYRQWFRFVTSDVGVWYEKHSTKNKLGILPNCQIVTELKFV